jgi:hypothetical protein
LHRRPGSGARAPAPDACFAVKAGSFQLGQIEELDWQLEYFASVFVETETNSRGKALSSGPVTRKHRLLRGIYLFRRAKSAV